MLMVCASIPFEHDSAAVEMCTIPVMCRETTTLERKLEKLATDIGNLGLAAAGSVLLFQSVQYTWQHFFVGGESWQWSYLSDYLHFIITAVTVVVRPALPSPLLLRPGLAEIADAETLMSKSALAVVLNISCGNVGCTSNDNNMRFMIHTEKEHGLPWGSLKQRMLNSACMQTLHTQTHCCQT